MAMQIKLIVVVVVVIGHLRHAGKVIPQGRAFLRRMITLLSAFQQDDHPNRLNQDFRLDLSC